ncbi:MAG: bifunctional precorrin-2 dehydrogenase/sirohydrochlorin ferrochelatase, partial [Nitrospiria bacterium]
MDSDQPDLYPIFLNLKNRRAVVIGGGAVAERKVGRLLASGADVTVVSLNFTPNLSLWGKERKIRLIQRACQSGDLYGAALAFAATNQPEVNRAVAEEAEAAGIWVNIADQSVPGDFLVPAGFSEKDVAVAVSTQGKNPALAVKVRDRIR